MLAALLDIKLVHFPGVCNRVADLLSRLGRVINPQEKLQEHIINPQWVSFSLICCILIGPFKFIAGFPPVSASLCSRAFSRSEFGFRPNTQCNYDSMFKLLLGYCVFRNVSLQN